MAKVTMCSLSKGVQALLLVLSQHWHPASATTTCGKARIAKEEKNLGAWTAERLLRKEGEGNTRWMAEEGGLFVMDLGCQKMIKSIKVDNSQHLPGNKNQQGDGSTGFKIVELNIKHSLPQGQGLLPHQTTLVTIQTTYKTKPRQ